MRGRPVRGEEEGFLQAMAAEDGAAKGGAGALDEQEVFLGEVEEDLFEEFGGKGRGVVMTRGERRGAEGVLFVFCHCCG